MSAMTNADAEGEQAGYNDERVSWWSEALFNSPACHPHADSSMTAATSLCRFRWTSLRRPLAPSAISISICDQTYGLKLSWDEEAKAWMIRCRDL
jgi:hypothetical protein